MATLRPTFPTGTIPEPLLESPGFLVAWLADRLTQRYDRAMGELGLRSTHHAVLVTVADTGPLRQARLEERLRVDHATFVVALVELERLGLVHREPDPEDRRTLRVALTDAGGVLVARTWEAVRAIEEDAFAALSPERRAALVAALAEVTRALAGAERHPSGGDRRPA